MSKSGSVPVSVEVISSWEILGRKRSAEIACTTSCLQLAVIACQAISHRLAGDKSLKCRAISQIWTCEVGGPHAS
jgi:hypothetical protein